MVLSISWLCSIRDGWAEIQTGWWCLFVPGEGANVFSKGLVLSPGVKDPGQLHCSWLRSASMLRRCVACKYLLAHRS